MTTKWRIYCETDDVWEYVWSETAPSVCPTDNGHTVNINSVNIIAREKSAFQIVPVVSKVFSKNFSQVAVLNYDPGVYGQLRRVSIMGYIDKQVTSYDVEVFDKTNNVSLVSNTFTNKNDYALQDIGIIANPPTSTFILAIDVKRTGGSGRKYARISQIIAYSEKEEIEFEE